MINLLVFVVPVLYNFDADTPKRVFEQTAEDIFLSVFTLTLDLHHFLIHACRSIPNAQSALEASRLFATKPHMAGTEGDLATAKDFLHLLQKEFGIAAPPIDPIYQAGSPASQDAIRGFTEHPRPTAWIDTYYPIMNTPLDRAVQIIDKNGTLIWEANLVEFSDDEDPEAGKYYDAVPTFHGLSRGGDVTGKLVDGNYCTHEVLLTTCGLHYKLTQHNLA